MKLPDLTELAVRNLRESLLRNSLTTIGISVGVASLVAMLSLGIGLQQLASRRLMKSGLFDTVVVTSRRDLRNFGREDERNGPAPGESRILDEPTRQEIERLPNVLEAYPDIRFITELRYEDKPHMTMVAALPASAKSNDAFETVQGQFFSSEMAPEVILQKAFAEELLGKTPKAGLDETKVAELAAPLLGKELTMRYAQRADFTNRAFDGRERQLRLWGSEPRRCSVFRGFARAETEDRRRRRSRSREHARANPGAGFSSARTGRGPARHAATDLREISRAASDQPVYSSVNVRVKNPSQMQTVEDAIKKMGFNTFSILDASRSIQQFFKVLDVFLGIFGSLALAVAFIGIVNTLVMAILERRREIGIMKAIGASDGDIKKLFFAEAGAMGILGGIVGVALGWAIGQVINLGTNVYLKSQSFPPEHFWSVPWWLVGFALLFSFLVSLAAGLYPAGRAARLDPVQALRYE